MGSPENDPDFRTYLSEFIQGLAELGWVEGRNLKIDYRWVSGGDASIVRMQAAAELVAARPELIVANAPPALVAVRATTGAIHAQRRLPLPARALQRL